MPTTDAFFAACAEARQKAAVSTKPEIADAIRQLEQLAVNAHQRTLIATVEIHGGLAVGDRGLAQTGLGRLAGATNDELLEVTRWFPDLTILGPVARRRDLLWRVIQPLCPAEDAACAFIEDPGLADANAILSGSWHASDELPRAFGRELRRWLGWASLDAWLLYRRPEYLAVLAHPSVRFDPAEQDAWEYAALEAIAELAKGNREGAGTRLRRLVRHARVPGWAHERIARIVTTYSPLAGSGVDEWLAAMPNPPMALERAVESIERAGAAFADVVHSGRHASYLRVAEDVEAFPWAVFCYFVASPPGDVAEGLAKALLSSVKRPTDVATWPWPTRIEAFASACIALTDRRPALTLLNLAAQTLRDPTIARAFVQVLESCEPEELRALTASDMFDQLGDAITRLSPGRQMMLKRRGVWRAVVDGTNVCFRGLSRGAGGQASLRFLKDALASLESAGFEERVVYFDASTRRYLSTPEAVELARMHARGEVCVISSGQADKFIIEAFLESPENSWIVTCDRFSDWAAAYPQLPAWLPQARLGFHVDPRGDLAWARSLEEPSGGRRRG